jgi:hypothetical protein
MNIQNFQIVLKVKKAKGTKAPRTKMSNQTRKATVKKSTCNRLLALLEQKEHQWHDDEYDAGKDW